MRQKKLTRRFDVTEATICRNRRAIIIKLQTTSLRIDYDLLGGDPPSAAALSVMADATSLSAGSPQGPLVLAAFFRQDE